MTIELNTEDARVIRGFIPINTLSGLEFDELCASKEVSNADDGEQLFTEGSADTDYYFLLEGSVSLEAGHTEVDEVKAGSENARFALAHHIPRKVTCIAQGKVRYLKLDSELFSEESVSEMLLQNDMVTDESQLVKEQSIPFLLKSPLFRQLPVSVLPGISACLDESIVEAGQTLVKQGEMNDTFYIIQEGQCKVTRRPPEKSKEVLLGKLGEGDTFGEFALLTDNAADVTVKTISECVLYTVGEKFFDQWVKQPLIRQVSWTTADQSGDVFLDVQTLDEYRTTHVKGSINYPFSTLRTRMEQLTDTDKYIVVSNDEKLGMAAVILLRQKQLDVRILEGGLNAVPEGSLDHILMPDSELIGADTESENVALETEVLEVPAVIGSPIETVVANKAGEQQELRSETQALDQQHQSKLVDEEAKEIESIYEQAIDIDSDEAIQVDDYSARSLYVRKLESKLQEVWKAYKKTRNQLHKSKRKYSACYRDYTRIEKSYHSLLMQPEAANEIPPVLNPAITADDINEQLQEEFTQQIEENKKLKQQNNLLKKMLSEAKKASVSSDKDSNGAVNLSSKTVPVTEGESLLLQIEELRNTVHRLEQNKTSQQKKAKKYVDENSKLRQLIQELAKQAMDEQAQGRALSSFEFNTGFASSDNAYDADSRMAGTGLEQNENTDSVLREISGNSIESTEINQNQETKGVRRFIQRLKKLLGTQGGKKARVITWTGCLSAILLMALIISMLLNTKEGHLLLKQIGF